MIENFDVVVIGSGPGGYSAALRCAQKGAKVAIIEKGNIGGVCLNCGCIPSKSLLACAHVYNLAKHASVFGVETENPKINWTKMQSHKDNVVTGLRKGLTSLIQGNKIKIFEGEGFVTAPHKISVEGKTPAQLEAAKIIIASGSTPVEIPFLPFDGKTIISSTEALSLPEIPKTMVVIGGGVIGCELGCVYASLGCKVTIIEALASILPLEDEWVGKLMTREFKKLGIDALTGKKVTGCEKTSSGAKIILEDGAAIETEKVLVSVGRRASCDKRTIDSLGLEMNKNLIKVNNKMQTSAEGVYAIGDAVGTTYLAHGAFFEAEIAADNVMGHETCVKDYALVPRAIYTFPEVASVGLNETKCRQQCIEVNIGRAFFKANGRSLAHNETVGEIRVMSDKKSRKILGVTMVGASVTEMITTARSLIGNCEEIRDVVFAHPTVSEVLKEAWEDAIGQSLHSMPKSI